MISTFVGGENDGRKIVHDGTAGMIRLPIAGLNFSCAPFKTEDYLRATLKDGDGGYHDFYVSTTINTSQAIEKLLAHYQPK